MRTSVVVRSVHLLYFVVPQHLGDNMQIYTSIHHNIVLMNQIFVQW